MFRNIWISCLILFSSAATAAPISYQFSGEVIHSYFGDSNGNSPFSGASFTGGITIDSEAAVNAGSYLSSTRFSGLVTDFSLSFDYQGGTYDYQPYLESIPGSWASSYSALWAEDNEGFEFRQHNYPSSTGSSGEFGPSGEIPDDYYVNGYYPHSLIFRSRASGMDLLDEISASLANFDLGELFNLVPSTTFDLRFTDPNHPDWQNGKEHVAGLVSGQLTSLVKVPEPGSIVLLFIGAIAVFASRRKFFSK